MKKRIFVAVSINYTDGLASVINSFKEDLASYRIKWVERHNLHITLAFIGDIDIEEIHAVSAYADNAVKNTGPFTLEIVSAGVFRNYRDVRVIWAGIAKSDPLMAIQTRLSAGLESAGLYKPPSGFIPHLTLGRPREKIDPGIMHRIISPFAGVSISEQYVGEIKVMESKLAGPSPVYLTVSSHSL